ncbi:MAG: ribonuclease Z [Defluviitaleaceae bacterium]|nr:ribonuclease Z [Defluviitaleaceae bacterium]
MLDIALVGTGGMMPLPGRFLSSMLCRINGSMILFDCGEGTQVSLRLLGWGFKQIDIICFTHFHGDHVSGLPGLLLTMAHADRTEPLTLIGPSGLNYIVNSLCVIAKDLPFPVNFLEWDAKTQHFYSPAHDDKIILRALPVHHRTPCFAYSVELLRRGKFDPARAKELDIPLKFWSALQKQMDASIVYNERTFTSDMVLGPPRKGLKVVFCTDTRPVAGLAPFAQGADLFICEGLYGDNDLLEKAAKRKHMIFSEAAAIAKSADVKELWLTHFSPSLPDPYNYLGNAEVIFGNVKAGKDRMSRSLRFEE